MYENDYIIRMIDELAAIVARVLFYRRAGRHDAAHVEIQNAYRTLLGTDAEEIRRRTVDEIAVLASGLAEVSNEAALALCRLIAEEAALVDELEGDGSTAAAALYEKCIVAFDAVRAGTAMSDVAAPGNPHADRSQVEDLLPSLHTAADKLSRAPHSLPAAAALARFFERVGEYGRAEDSWYGLAAERFPDVHREIRAFYARIAKLPDGALEAGNLPREEIEEAIGAYLERPIVISTPRLSLREMSVSDADYWYQFFGLDSIRRFLPDRFETEAEMRRVLLWLAGNYDLPRREVIRITLALHLPNGDDRPIGWVSFGPLPEDEAKRELAYAVHPDHVGNGYATEAAAALLAWVAEQWPGVPVYASVDPGNTASLRVLDKLGFRQVVTSDSRHIIVRRDTPDERSALLTPSASR